MQNLFQYQKLSKEEELRLKTLNAYYILKNVNIICQIFGILKKHFTNGKKDMKHQVKNCFRLKIIQKSQKQKDKNNLILKLKSVDVDKDFEPLLVKSDLKEANQRLTEWLIFSNLQRPNQPLNYQTPIKWYTK